VLTRSRSPFSILTTWWYPRRSTRCKVDLFSVCCSVLQCVAGRPFQTLQCVAVCCSVLQCFAGRPSQTLQCVAVCCSVLQCVAVCCSVLQCVAGRPSPTLQCVAVCCAVLRCVALCCNVSSVSSLLNLLCVAACCIVLQCLKRQLATACAVCCSVLQCVALCCSVLQCLKRQLATKCAVLNFYVKFELRFENPSPVHFDLFLWSQYKHFDTSGILILVLCCTVLQCLKRQLATESAVLNHNGIDFWAFI